MNAVVVVVALVAGCGFRPFPSAAAGDALGDLAGDIAVSPGAEPIAVAPFCDPADPHLVVCYELEGNTLDGSSHHLDATMTNVTFAAGHRGQAMHVVAGSATDVANSALFDVTAITIEAWIDPDSIPTGNNRAGILDMDGQYGMFLHPNGELQCTMVNGVSLHPSPNIMAGRWTHVACTYDGTTTNVYVDGVQVATGTGGGTLATGGNSGISLGADNPPGSGSPLNGWLDDVRMMNVARTPVEIAHDAS